MSKKIKIGITHGDVNGVGYEVIIKSLQDSRILDFCIPVIYGSSKILAYHRKSLNIENFIVNNIKEAKEANQQKINLINCCEDNVRVELGKPSKVSGEAALSSLERAVSDLNSGFIDAIVTAPINKDSIQGEEFNFAGHTEYLNSKSKYGKALMLLIKDTVRIGVVTGHIPVKEVANTLSKELILEKIKILETALKRDFGIVKPRIAVLGLNPHIGDNGLIGDEEEKIIAPAIDISRDRGISAFGPYPADGFFGSSDFAKFDAILAMYHDQGLIPFKILAFEEGVNYTAGLSFIRTSPAHGTAYDIVGKGKASELSFRKAIYEAIDIYRNRKMHHNINKNPLKHHEINENEKI